MDIFHKPIDMEEMMRCIKPQVKDKHIDKDLLDHFKESELILSAFPVSEVWKLRFYKP